MDTNAQLGDKNDGKVSIRFSEEDLEAWADFTPPVGNGLPVTNDYLIALMNKHNILYGVRWDTLKDTAFQCNLDKKPVKDVLIALGDPPVKEINEYYELNPHLVTSSTPIPDKDRNYKIDYRAYSPFVIVKKDQVLALKKPGIPGREGKNVHGGVIPYSTSRTEGVTGGKHTVTTEKYILSEINGQLIENSKELNVFEDLTIKGSVGYATGNIIFPGDITINGTVADGFKIYSGGSVTIKQTLDATEVNTKGDLTVSGGIIGRGRGFLKVGGSMRTKFIQNCRVACRKTITVDSEINNSSIYTMETLEMGDKGRVLGGEVYAIHGVRAGGIGKNLGKATRIHCGVDFTLQKDKENCNNTLRLLSEKLRKLREMMADPALQADPEKQAKMAELLHRLEEEQKKNTSQIGNLMGRINADENAVVEVSGEIAPGTLIEICEVALFVAEPLKRVRVRLDKPSGKVVHEAL